MRGASSSSAYSVVVRSARALQTIELTTPRLLLRPPQAQDLDAWAAFSADPETMRYLGGVQGRSAAWRAMTRAGNIQARAGCGERSES